VNRRPERFLTEYLQISREEVVVRRIGKDATVLYEFKKRVDIMQGS
jgi:hypothetical protein